MIASILIMIFLFFAPQKAGAAIYRYFDADGSLHFTDTPERGAVKVAGGGADFSRAEKARKRHAPAPTCLDLNKNPLIEDLIQNMCRKYGVDPSLVKAVIRAESGYDRMAVSPKGAMGLMQLMPGTANSLGVFDPFDPEQNIDGGVRYLSSLLERFGGNVSLALAAYNAGPGSIEKYGSVPPYEETGTYVKKILASYNSPGEVQTPSSRERVRRGFSSFPRNKSKNKNKNKKTSFASRKSTIIYRIALKDGTVLYSNNPSGF